METKILRVGLTGGIGCGKTTVLNEFKLLGVPCFISDQVAKSYYQDPGFVMQVSDTLGCDISNPDGTANTRKIASLIFSDRGLLQKVNALIHPKVGADFERWCGEQHYPYVIMESAILFECGLRGKLDKVVAVYLDKEERMSRLQVRDKATREELEQRMQNQLSAEAKMDMADYVVLNYEGNPRQRQVEWVHRQLLRLQQ